MLKSDQRTLRGKSANAIKNILIAESLRKQKLAADRDAEISAYAGRRAEWLRATSECREMSTCEESQHIQMSQDQTVTLRVKHSNLNQSLTNISSDLNEFTHRAEEVLGDTR